MKLLLVVVLKEKLTFFKIFENKCNLIQTINAHVGRAMKIREPSIK